VEKAFQVLGRNLFIAGLIPAMVFVGLNLVVFGGWGPISGLFEQLGGEGPIPALAERIKQLVELERLGGLAIGAIVIGTLLFAFNRTIIQWYEGLYPIQRRWLLARNQRANAARHEQLFGRLLGIRRMRAEALAGLRSADDQERNGELSRRADAALIALDEGHANLEKEHPARTLPITRELIRPTALGNAYAVMEEYPFERYGIDSIVFWPRMVAVLPKDYREGIGDQKTTCDLLLNSSLLLTVFAFELLVRAIVIPESARAALAAGWLGVLVLAYGFYRAAVAETATLGNLVAGAFDLYRRQLLRQMGFIPPVRLDQERDLWLRLAAFVRRGEDFYYPPAELVEQPVPRAT
jgi:hypothetical protein